MAKVLALANQKGGVGKTTTSINLAASLAAMKKRVLLIDLDPQGNATMGSGIDKYDLAISAYDVLMEEAPIVEAAVFSENAQYHVVGTNSDLTAAEVGLLQVENREFRLANALKSVRGDYDYILLDCPPSLSMLTINGLTAADGVIIPMQCEYYALEGMSDLIQTIERVQQTVNPELEIQGVLRTMYDPRNSLTRDVSKQLSDFFDDKLYRTCVPRNVRLAEAPSFGLPALKYDKSSRGAMAYLALAGEILRRDQAQAS